MSRKYLQELIKNLQEFYKCPSCNTAYHFDDIKFLGQIDQYCFVQLSCHQCSMPVLATVPIDGQSSSDRRRSKRDVTQAEGVRFAKRGAIRSDEIAEFHRYLIDHRGPIGKISK